MGAMSLHHSAAPRVRRAQGVPVKPVAELVLSGDMDMQDADELERYLTGGRERGWDIVIDLADVRLVDCVCLEVLVRAARAAHALDSVISLVAPSELVRMTLRLTGTDSLFLIFDDRAAVRRHGDG